MALFSKTSKKFLISFKNEWCARSNELLSSLLVQKPDNLSVETPQATEIVIKGIDKQLVGQFSARIREIRKPEPYKGKGIRYKDEHIRKKAGKTVGAGAA